MKKFENYCFEKDLKNSIDELAIAVCESGIPVEIVIEDLQHFMTLDADLQEQAVSELELINEVWPWSKKDPTSAADAKQQQKDQRNMQAGLKRDAKTQDAINKTNMMKGQLRAQKMGGALKQGAASVGAIRDDGEGWGQKAWRGIKGWFNKGQAGGGQPQGQGQAGGGQPQPQVADQIEKAIFPTMGHRMGASPELLKAVRVIKQALGAKGKK